MMVNVNGSNKLTSEIGRHTMKEKVSEILEKFLSKMDKVDTNTGVEYRILANLERKKTNMLGSAA